MAPPPNVAHAVHPVLRDVTEDTPPDLLEGTMDLLVVLPSKKTVRMTVNRRTPMMDLLIQVTSSNKINPGGHIVQVRNERGIELPYKPSTPIGALDTTTIDIVPKNQVNEYIIVKKQTAKIANQPFEQTFRLQVHLPRNQLYVTRVAPKTLLADILQEVCREKNLDYTKYEMRHPVKLDEKLPLDRRIGDFGLQEVTVVSRNSRINSSVSTADIMALQNESTKGLDSAFKHSRSSVGDSSVSSESAASDRGISRGISPSRSDDSRSISPLPQIRPKLKLNATMSNASSSSGTSSAVPKSQSHPLVKTSTSLNSILQAPPRPKKRAAPPPPTLVSPNSSTMTLLKNGPSTNSIHNNLNANPSMSPINDSNCIRQTMTTTSVVSPVRPTPRKKDPPKEPPCQSLTINHSRHSSDSSGYHESCVVCEQQDSQMHRFDRQQSVPAGIGNLSHLPSQRVSGCHSVSNLTTVSSISSTSLASSNGGQRKRKAPKPPTIPLLQAQKEIEEDIPIPISTSTPTNIGSKSQTSLNQSVPISSSSNTTTSRPVSASPTSNHSSNIISSKKLANNREATVEVQVDVHTDQESKVQEIIVNLQKEQEGIERPERVKKQSDTLKNQSSSFENHHHHSSSEPTSSLEESLPSSLSSSPGSGSSQGSTSSSPIPPPTTTKLVESGRDVEGGAVVESSQENFPENEKHSNCSSPLSSKGSEGHSSLPSSVSEVNHSSNSVVQSVVPTVETMSRPISSPSSILQTAGEDHHQPVASRNNNTQAALVNSSSSVAQPSAPPRKPRTPRAKSVLVTPEPSPQFVDKENTLQTERENENSSSSVSRPKPKPRPRPNSGIPPSQEQQREEKEEQEINTTIDSSVHRSQQRNETSAPPPVLRNPLVNRIGVKLFPDNVVEEHRARFSKEEPNSSSSVVHDASNVHSKPSTPARTHPPPQIVSRESSSSPSPSSRNPMPIKSSKKTRAPDPVKNPIVASNSNSSAISTNSSSSSSSVPLSASLNPPLSSSSSALPKVEPRKANTAAKSDSKSTDSVKAKSEESSGFRVAKKISPPVVSTGKSNGMTNDIIDDTTVQIHPHRHRGESSELDDLEDTDLELFEMAGSKSTKSTTTTTKSSSAPLPPILTVSASTKDNVRRSNGPTKSDSDALDPTETNLVNLDEDEDGHGKVGDFTRTASDRYLEKKSSTYGGKNSRQLGGVMGSGGSPGQQNKKSSLNRWQNFDSLHEIEEVDVHNIQDDSVLLSSESEASYTDSGHPQTETITPSPIDIDMDKDMSSAGSSRRSSISLDQPEDENALREILQAKIEKEQEIVDKAFEGIEMSEDREGAETANSNFDFAQSPSMTNLSSGNPAELDDGAFSSSNDEEKELKDISSGPEDSSSLMTGADMSKSLGGSKKSAPARKLPKSESFSHNSEFDVKMKRKLYSKEGKVSAVARKSSDYISSSDDEELTGGRHKDKNQSNNSNNNKTVGRTGSMQNLSSVINGGGHKGDSMKNQKGTGLVNNRRTSPSSSVNNDGFRKANSVMNFQELDENLSQNPQLLASFRSELESQFEQWKEQFLQKHLAGSRSSSLDTDSEPTVRKSKEEVDRAKSLSSSTAVLESRTKVKGDGDKRSVDSPTTEKKLKETVITTQAQVHLPKVIHSQEKTPSVEKPSPIFHSERVEEPHLLVTTTTKELKSVENPPVTLTKSAKDQKERLRQEEDRVEKSTTTTTQVSQSSSPRTVDQESDVPRVVHTVTRTHHDMPVESKDRESHMEGEEIVELREKKTKPVVTESKSMDSSDEEPRIYRYTGPPTINLGTWGERPQRSVSVKRDNDYIMGMGQYNSKANEGRPTLGSVAKRIHSFVSPPVAAPPPLTKPTATVNPSSSNNSNNNNNNSGNSNNTTMSSNPVVSRPKSIAAIYTMNAMSSSSTESMGGSNRNSVGSPVSNVVSSWKQRLEQTEKERQSSHALPSSSQNSFENFDGDSHKEIVLNEPSHSPATTTTATTSLERVKKSTVDNNNHNSASNGPAKTFKISSYGETRKVHPLASNFSQNSTTTNPVVIPPPSSTTDSTDSASDYSGSSNSRPMSATSNITIASLSDSTSSSPVPYSSLSEKKKFFQGVKPVESNGKEMPIPAQNLKGSIASIQKVFEQHPQQKLVHNGGGGSLGGSGVTSNSTSPFTSKESSPAPSIASIGNSNSNNSIGLPPSISSTMMVQKVMKGSGSINLDNFRRTPSPSTSSLSSISSKSENERYSPSPTDGPIRISTSTNRIETIRHQPQPPVTTTMGTTAPATQELGGNIKNVGNKSIIIVGSSDLAHSRDNNNIFKQQLKVTAAPPSNSTSNVVNTNSTKVNGAYNNSNPNLKIEDKNDGVENGGGGISIKFNGRENNVILKKTPTQTINEPTPAPISTGKVSSLAANLSSNNNFFSSLQRQTKSQPLQQSSERVSTLPSKSMANGDKPIIIEQLEKPRKTNGVESSHSTDSSSKNSTVTPSPKGPSSKNVEIIHKRNSTGDINSNGGPPPPPPMDKLRPVSLALSQNYNSNNKSKSLQTSSPSKNVTSPTSPSDPRSEIFDSIKNANFVLRKTNSTMLLK